MLTVLDFDPTFYYVCLENNEPLFRVKRADLHYYEKAWPRLRGEGLEMRVAVGTKLNLNLNVRVNGNLWHRQHLREGVHDTKFEIIR